jgi:PAS domain S-box-containing protein
MNAKQITQPNFLDISGLMETALHKSEYMYRRLADISPDMTAVICEGSFLYINPAGAEILGAGDSEEIIGKSLHEILPAAESDFLLEQIRHTLDENQFRRFEYSLQSGEKKVWFDGSFSPMSQSSVVWIAHHISKRKQVEEEKTRLDAQMKNQRERLKNIVATVPGVVWEAWGEPDAATQRINFVSEYVKTLLGYSIEEWITTPNFWLSIVHPEDKESAVLNAAETFASRKAGTNRFRWIAKEGKVIWVEVHSVAICDEAGNPIGMRGVAMDTGERKQAEELRVRRVQQTALRADISAAFASKDSLQEILQQCAEALVQNLDAAFARIWMLNADEDILELYGSAGLYTHLDGAHARIPVGELKIGMIAQERKPHLTNDVQNDSRISNREWAKKEGIVAFAAIR